MPEGFAFQARRRAFLSLVPATATNPRPLRRPSLQTIAAVAALKTAPQQADAAPSAAAVSSSAGGSSSAAASSSSGGNGSLTLHDLRAWARDRLPPYQLPRHLKLVEAIPRNAMGKVNKKELRQQLFPERVPDA